jgi:hypothetical protein
MGWSASVDRESFVRVSLPKLIGVAVDELPPGLLTTEDFGDT